MRCKVSFFGVGYALTGTVCLETGTVRDALLELVRENGRDPAAVAMDRVSCTLNGRVAPPDAPVEDGDTVGGITLMLGG